MNYVAPFLLTTVLLVSPALSDDALNSETEDGFVLMEEGARLLLRGMMGELDEVLSEMETLAAELGPMVQELQTLIEDIRDYELPEMLPNGDIIIRRRIPLEPEGEVDI